MRMASRPFGLLRALSLALVAAMLSLGLAAATAPSRAAGEAGDQELSKLWSELDPSDQAVIRAAAGNMGSALTTTKDTPNDRFWSALATRGYLVTAELSDAYPENAVAVMQAAGFRLYKVTGSGVAEMPKLFDRFEGR